MFAGETPNALAEPRAEEESLTKKGKKKKTVHWAEEEQLKHYFYFDLDETERGTAHASGCTMSSGEGCKQLLQYDNMMNLLFILQSTSTRLRTLGRPPNGS